MAPLIGLQLRSSDRTPYRAPVLQVSRAQEEARAAPIHVR